MNLLSRKKAGRLLSFALLFQLLLGNAFSATAAFLPKAPTPGLPSPSSFFSDFEKRYHIDNESVQGMGESLNVSDNKKPAPQVTMFFSPSDPRPGEKVSAKAFPMYFTNNENQLYYTWFLKHAECGLAKAPLSKNVRQFCDRDGDGEVTVEDWKIEAMRSLVQNGFDTTTADYSSDTDNDGYKARLGGDNQVGDESHCYVNDPKTGKNYELLADDARSVSFTCPGGTTPVCVVSELQIVPKELDIAVDSTAAGGSASASSGSDGITGSGSSSSTGGSASSDATASGQVFNFNESSVCYSSGKPSCNNSGQVQCSVGNARCVADPVNTTSCGSALSRCTGGTSQKTVCKHLFPNANGFKTGDGSFTQGEERFWGTDPKDPDTADNGNKDEANLTGLGQSTLTWNFVTGDQVGVAIEGTSMITTKYENSSSMIMWAFSKNNCPIDSDKNITGSMTKKIKGYDVVIPTIKMDLNDCIEKNLVDPVQGGQATNLEVSVSASPDSPNNDESSDGAGDMISAQASLSNFSRNLSDILFDWDVEMSNNVQFINGGSNVSANVTDNLRGMGLMGTAKGIALDTLRVKLDIPDAAAKTLGGRTLGRYLLNDVGYLRFTAKATESFASGIVRKGKSDVIVKFTSTGKKITAYKVQPVLAGGIMRVALPTPADRTKAENIICNGGAVGASDNLDRVACRVIKNEIIGLAIDPAGLSDFKWTINGTPLSCSQAAVSSDCIDDAQNHINFFPVSGDVGDTYNVTVTANDLSSATQSDKVVVLNRVFHVVKPQVSIKPADANAWPKLLGQYKGLGGTCASTGGMCPEYSDSVFEGFSGGALSFKAEFMPNFLAQTTPAPLRQWTVDGVVTAEAGGVLSFAATKPAPDVYNIALQSSLTQSQEIRQALSDIWGISQLESPEILLSASVQVQLREPGLAQGALPGAKKYLAAIASYIPSSVIFSFRIVLSVILILFTAQVLFVLLPEHPGLFRNMFRR